MALPVPEPIAQEMAEEELLRRGLEHYERTLRPILEPDLNGQVVAIHVASGDYEVARSSGDGGTRAVGPERCARAAPAGSSSCTPLGR